MLQFVNEATVEEIHEPASTRRMARFFFAVFWTIVFTGCIRKWVFPGTPIFYLTQDVPIVLAYGYAIWTGIYSRGMLAMGIIFMSFVLMFQACMQLIGADLSPFIAALGIHNYLFYLPILIVFPVVLTETYRRRFVLWNLLLSIPMCLLVMAQAVSPKQAFINRTSEGDAFGLPGAEVARVSGTYNFVSFYGIWVGIAVALNLGEWLLPKRKRLIKNTWVMIACTIAVNICHLVSASRITIVLAVIAVVGAFVAAVVLRSVGSLLAIGGIVLLLPVAVGLTYLISPAEVAIVTERFTGDRYVDDSQNRVMTSIIGFATEPEFSLIGAGIGLGTDAAHAGSADAYKFTYALSENDLIRIVKELGTPVGLFYVLSRLTFAIGMIFLSIRMVRNGSSPHVLPLSFMLFAQTSQGDWTRSAAMSMSQVMVGYAFILGVYYHPDQTSFEDTTNESFMRSE